MRVTRSATSSVVPSLKRAANPLPTPRKRAKTAPAAVVLKDVEEAEDPVLAAEDVKESLAAAKKEGVLLHPALTFMYADARAHLESVDPRWGHVMDKLRCKPFEGKQTTAFEPFRSLASSIIGQQVSWLAARSIQHKFVRLFYPHLPEKLAKHVPAAKTDGNEVSEEAEEEASPFPTPAQILALPNPVPTLRSAGLSGRKVEYVLELAERFHDGRIEAKKLWEMDDAEVRKTLLDVRGIGIWTVQMFLIFSMKRPDVLPVGDLGIQKNLCKWYSAEPSLVPAIHPRKLTRAATPPPSSNANTAIPSTPEPKNAVQITAYPTPSTPSSIAPFEVVHVPSVPASTMVFPPTSNNLTPVLMKARLNKKLKGNVYLSPTEMEELTAEWAPYRSVACWYLWSITDGTGDA